jgi:Fic family protein
VSHQLKVVAMNSDDFVHPSSGTLIRTIQGVQAFVPAPLPPRALDFGSLARPLERATLALGQLGGIGKTLPNPHLLIRPFKRVEAVASSKIEGTVTTPEQLLMLEVEANPLHASSDTREVRNYTTALDHGLKRLKDLPVSKRLIQEMHEILLSGVSADRAAQFEPGKFKIHQNWIGGRTIQTARFVPPPPAEAIACLDDLEKYVNQEDGLPILMKLALIHYQFETIHPFPDGNGRIGRLLIPLILCERGVLPHPLLYLSAFFEKHYSKYIDLMFAVSTRGEWTPWIDFFLTGVAESAASAIRKSSALQDLHKEYMGKVQSARSSASLAKIVNDLFDIPAITIPHAMKSLGVSYNSAKNNMNRLVNLGIVREGKSARPQWYYASQIMDIAITEDDFSTSEVAIQPNLL